MTDSDEGTSRRDAIKKTAAAGVAAGMVWSAPRVEGLTLRPDYAAASSSMLTWSVEVDAFLASEPLQGLQGSLKLNRTGGFAATTLLATSVLRYSFYGGAFGSGLGNGSFTITSINSPGGAVNYDPTAGQVTNGLLSAGAILDKEPAFPLGVTGNFTCA